MLRGLLEVEAAFEARLDAQQDTIVRPAEAEVLGKVYGDAVFGFRPRWRQNLHRIFSSQWLENLEGT